MRKKSKIIAIILASICAVALIVNYINMKNEKDWMQNNIDQIFQYNFSQMVSDLTTIHMNPDMSDEGIRLYNTRITKTGNMAHEIFSLTSYKDNHKLGGLVGMIEQATGYDSINSINMTEELHKKLVDIQMYHFTDEEEHRKVAELFHTRIRELSTVKEQEKALKETLIKVKDYSIEQATKKLAPTDIQGLQELMVAKRALQDLQKLHISIN